MILNLAVQSNAIRLTRFYARTVLRRSFGAGVKQRGTVAKYYCQLMQLNTRFNPALQIND